MGLFTALTIYKYGKGRAERKAQDKAELAELENEICTSYGYLRGDHGTDLNESCPV